jgi:multidrug resistance efflux pump
MKVTFTVHEKDRWRLRKGQPVKVILDAYVDMEFHGMIVNVGRMPLEVAEGQVARRFEVSASISEHDSRLKPGMSARVIIELGGQS